MITSDPFDTGSQELLRELGQGEKLLWSGRPVQGFLLRPRDLVYIPFSLLWGGFAIFWEFMAVRGVWLNPRNSPGFVDYLFPLWGIPFVAAGLYMIFGRFIYDVYVRRTMVYGVTNARVIILTRLFRRSAKSLSLHSLGDITVKEDADGRGTIIFFGCDAPGRGQVSPAFDGIPDVRRVHQLIMKAQRESFGVA